MPPILSIRRNDSAIRRAPRIFEEIMENRLTRAVPVSRFSLGMFVEGWVVTLQLKVLAVLGRRNFQHHPQAVVFRTMVERAAVAVRRAAVDGDIVP